MSELKPNKVSRPGQYSGYSEVLYSEIVRNSQYVPGLDGSKLAVDIYRPGEHGQAVSQTLAGSSNQYSISKTGPDLCPCFRKQRDKQPGKTWICDNNR